MLKAIYASATNHAIITMDNDGRISTWNSGAEKILGYAREEIIGEAGSVIFTPEDRANDVPHQEFEAACVSGRADDFRWHLRKDGSVFWGEGVVTPLLDETGANIGALKIVYDATEKKMAEDGLLRAANFDTLTALPNRAHLHTRLAEMIAAMSRSDEMLLLHIVDLDYFKQINDSLGHDVGDLLLQQAAQRLRALVRGTDFIARLGGDEFIIVQSNAHSAEAGAYLSSKVIEALSLPFSINGHEMHIGASIGIAIFPQDASEPYQLLKKADLALYKVKGNGRGGFSYYTEQLNADAYARSRNLGELKRCVKQQAYWLQYQPEIDCESGKVVTLEALVRFHSKILTAQPLDDLIALATEAGMMTKVGSWVLSAACAQHRKWHDAGLRNTRISVNFCAGQLADKNLTRQIIDVLDEHGLRPQDLEIEITEREIYSVRPESLALLEDLRKLGVTIVLDDFGTGYSSLSYLRQLPIDRLKLDREFLYDIPDNRQSCVIAESVIKLAHALDIEVVAEGVESAEQVAYCLDKKCDAMQGFFFSRPLSEPDLSAFLSIKS